MKQRAEPDEFYWVPCTRTIGAFKMREKGDETDQRLFDDGMYFLSEKEALTVSRNLYYQQLRKM